MVSAVKSRPGSQPDTFTTALLVTREFKRHQAEISKSLAADNAGIFGPLHAAL